MTACILLLRLILVFFALLGEKVGERHDDQPCAATRNQQVRFAVPGGELPKKSDADDDTTTPINLSLRSSRVWMASQCGTGARSSMNSSYSPSAVM
jgi:hypothetical protein